jgi:hypothetical protein
VGVGEHSLWCETLARLGRTFLGAGYPATLCQSRLSSIYPARLCVGRAWLYRSRAPPAPRANMPVIKLPRLEGSEWEQGPLFCGAWPTHKSNALY